MKISGLLLCVVCALLTGVVFAQAVERDRPVGWDKLVPGGRFMDRFEAAHPIGPLVTNVWGGANVLPRDPRLGIEESEHSYWGGNITKIGRDYHLFVARWKESEPRGHMYWPHSEVVHAVSSRPDGDFKVVEVLGKGHNPELFSCKDGSWAVYCIDNRGKAHVYRTPKIEAGTNQWHFARMQLDLNGREKFIEGESNFSFCRRPNGSVLAVCRGGGIWLSEDGVKPFVQQTDRVYPDVAGRFEDPVLWRDEVQYHLVVNDWLGRVAWYLTSPDGFHWTTLPGEAYTPDVCPGWFKLERMRVFQDEYGRVIQVNFAVIDCVKKQDRGNDSHSSKNLTVPFNPGRRTVSFTKVRRGLGWEVRIAKEKCFNPLTDIDVDSVIMGPQSMVAFGAGVKAMGTSESNGDLVLQFPSIELLPVMEVLGKEKSGRLFYTNFRTDGLSLQ